jgi:type III secretion YscU/HrpY family protein
MADKTEQPTPKRLRQARKKGQVLKSQDVTAAAMFLGSVALLAATGPRFFAAGREILLASLRPELFSGRLAPAALLAHLGSSAADGFLACLPLVGGLMGVAVAANYAQVRSFFSAEVIKPKFDKLNPLTGFKNLFFRAQTYIDLIKTILKFALIALLLYLALRGALRDLVLAARVTLGPSLALTTGLLFGLLYKVAGGMVLIAAADYFIQRKLHLKQLMMSKDEVMREFKEDEGDPHVKQERKHLHQEILNADIGHRVPQSAAVVVNPTHLAVALEYDSESMSAPIVGVKGKDQIARKIIETAKANRVPVLRNVSLAWRLNDVETDHPIPEDLYEPVAEVLRWVADQEQQEERRRNGSN